MPKLKMFRRLSVIEVAIVVCLLFILGIIILLAITQLNNSSESRNVQRENDVNSILSSVKQYVNEQGHSLADFGYITVCNTNIGEGSKIGTDKGNINLKNLLVDIYIIEIPTNPQLQNGSNGSEGNTGYSICRLQGNKIRIDAVFSENNKKISAIN